MCHWLLFTIGRNFEGVLSARSGIHVDRHGPGTTMTDVTSSRWHPAVVPITPVYDIGYMRNPLTTARDRKAGGR